MTLSSQASLPLSSHHESSVGDVAGSHMKVKLRLCYGGRFEQIGSHSWKFVGGEYFNESVPYGIRYADFMFKLSEKFRTAVSVKYHAPGEELVPDQLISVQDDADLQELIEDYMAHLQRPGTPCKTFRIKVFVFMASEEPLTPDEIMEGQHFFSESQLGMPARLNAVRLLDGRSSFGSTLSSVGTPSTRHQDLSTSDWPASSAGQALGLGMDEAESAEVFNEQEILERMRTAVSRNPPPRLAAQQRRLSAFSDLPAGQQDAALVSPEQLAAAGLGVDEAAGADGAYAEQLRASMLRQISQEMEEVLEAIDRQQQQESDRQEQQDAAAVATMRAIMREGRDMGGGSRVAAAVTPEQEEADSEEEEYPEYPDYDDTDISGPGRAMAEQSQDQLDLPADLYTSDSDSMVRALPTHISDFGESPPRELGTLLTEAALGATAAGAQGQEGVAEAAAAGAEEEQGTLHLPSHISAFGDDLGPLSGAPAMLSGNCGLDDGGFGGDIEPRLSGGQLGCARPRTQDSSFSLDGGAVDGDAQGLCAPGGIGAERAGSGDSLNSLPKLQPVHRLAKPDLKIEKRIGEGAFGEVSVAKAPLYGTVAVKWLKSDRFTKHFASFGREAALLADLNHPNVLRFYGVVTESAADSSVIGIMTEYIRGGSMSAFLRMARTLLPLRVRCELALGAANGLAYLHELRIVHFDLKPDNLLLDAPPAVVRTAAGLGVEELPRRTSSPTSPDCSSSRDGVTPGSNSSSKGLLRGGSGVGSANTSPAGGNNRTGRRNSSGQGGGSGSGLMDSSELPVVKVADFGLSKHKLNSSYVSSCRDLRGTLPYMAPELVSDPERVCEKADVWSLGVVMWEMLTRRTPFQDLPPQQILLGLMCGNLHLDVPEWCEPEWRYLLEACMEPNPNNRPTMRELARQLEAIRDQQLQHEQELLELQEQEQQVQEPARVSQGQLQQQQQSKEQPQQKMVQLQACSGQQAAAVALAPAPVVPLQQPCHEQQQVPLLQQPQVPQLQPLQQAQAPLLPVLQQQQAAVVLEQLQPGHLQLQYPPMQQQELLLQQQLCPTPQQEVVLPVLHLPAGFTEVDSGAGTYGAVCEHYWPQQSPVTPAAAAAPSPGSGHLGQLQARLQL